MDANSAKYSELFHKIENWLYLRCLEFSRSQAFIIEYLKKKVVLALLEIVLKPGNKPEFQKLMSNLLEKEEQEPTEEKNTAVPSDIELFSVLALSEPSFDMSNGDYMILDLGVQVSDTDFEALDKDIGFSDADAAISNMSVKVHHFAAYVQYRPNPTKLPFVSHTICGKKNRKFGCLIVDTNFKSNLLRSVLRIAKSILNIGHNKATVLQKLKINILTASQSDTLLSLMNYAELNYEVMKMHINNSELKLAAHKGHSSKAVFHLAFSSLIFRTFYEIYVEMFVGPHIELFFTNVTLACHAGAQQHSGPCFKAFAQLQFLLTTSWFRKLGLIL